MSCSRSVIPILTERNVYLSHFFVAPESRCSEMVAMRFANVQDEFEVNVGREKVAISNLQYDVTLLKDRDSMSTSSSFS